MWLGAQYRGQKYKSADDRIEDCAYPRFGFQKLRLKLAEARQVQRCREASSHGIASLRQSNIAFENRAQNLCNVRVKLPGRQKARSIRDR